MNGYESVGLPIEQLTMSDRFGPAPKISHMDLAEILEAPDRSRVFVNWNANVLASAPNQLRLREALAREDLLVIAVDLFPTDTVRYADIVLPAASFLESDDLVFSYFHGTISPQLRVKAPAGASLPNSEIFRRLASAMGFTDPELFVSDHALIDTILQTVKPGISFETLKGKGTVFVSDEPRQQFAGFQFGTPSGRIEVDSDVFLRSGLAAAPDPFDFPISTPGRLTVISPSHKMLMNSTYGNDPGIRQRIGPPTIILTPSDAAARGLLAGDEVDVCNAGVRVRMQIDIAELAPNGVAVCYKSRWPAGDPDGRNVNALNPGLRADLGGGTAVNSLEVDIIWRARRPGQCHIGLDD
jgi:anaerobic selenocysteine-containing dehydrogenase